MDSVGFKDKVYLLVAQIPIGQVTTYGDLAALAGHPYAARIVGGIAHFGLSDLPWHRIVNRFGGLASGYWGGREAQKAMLEAEKVEVNELFIVDNFEGIRWRPQINH